MAHLQRIDDLLHGLLDALADRVAGRVAARLHAQQTAFPAPVTHMTIELASERTGLTRRKLRADIAAGRLRASRPGGGRLWVVAEADLGAYLAGGTDEPIDAATVAREILSGRRRRSLRSNGTETS